MEIQGTGGIRVPLTGVPAPLSARENAGAAEEHAAVPPSEQDTFTLSEEAKEWLNRQEETEPDKAECTSVGRSMGINAGKLARMLAAARTKAQIRAVIAQIQQDLRECESGAAQGADVDEASVKAAENLLNQAKQRMGQAKDGEASPEEEAAFSLASVF